ncbi:hypothetical protein [Bartonella sp. CB74]|uniref:hypothetical protein n=1 Tax=Bartonella sp. CB74 TaxID=3113620 RepID=UPI002F962984
MRKLIVTTVMIAAFGASNLIVSNAATAGDSRSLSTQNAHQQSSSLKVFKNDLEIIENYPVTLTAEQEIELLEKAISGESDSTLKTQYTDRLNKRYTELNSYDVGDNGFFLKNPQHIYDKNKRDKRMNFDVSLKFKEIENKEDYFNKNNKQKTKRSVHTVREIINERNHDMVISDKALSLHVFEGIMARYNEITGALNTIAKKDIKDTDLAKMQIQLNGELAMIQNEATKLQMVAHLRNAEKTLIKQLKFNRNAEILNRKNTKMPRIRYSQ